MSLTVAQILEAIMSGAEIPTTAPVIRKLVELNGEDVPLRQDDIVALARNDTALTVRLLRTINPTPHLEEEVLTVEKAISAIPLSHLRNLLLSVKFIDDTPSSHQNEQREAYHLGWLWERNLCTAVAAEVITSRLKRGNPLEHRTLAVLLHMGTLFLLHNFGDSYRFVFDQWHAGGGSLSEIEEDIMGINHWMVAQQLARAWNLGHKVEEVFKALMEKRDTSIDGLDLRVLTFAETCASVLFENNNSTGFERGVQAAQALLGLDRSRFTDLLQEIALKSDAEMMRYAGVREGGVSYIELLMTINRELGRATLTYEQMVRELEAAMKKAEELAQRLEEANRKLREAASIDPLTKIYNRRYFEEFLSWNFNRAKRYGTTLGCLMIDIDHFKKVNDLYGHLTGDRVLQEVSSALQARLRSTDVLARYGGEEFVVLLPETTPLTVGWIAQKLHNAIREISFPLGEGQELQIRVSVGYAHYNPQTTPHIQDPLDLVKAADQNMYQAKNRGRDQIWPPLDQDLLHLQGTS